MTGAACDVAILGGGPAGCSTAIALRARHVARVVVVEPSGYREIRVGESIPPDTRTVMGRLGFWPGFVEDDHEPCLGSCSCWGSKAPGYNDFLFNPHGHGWHLNRDRFDARLAAAAGEAGATLLPGWRFVGREPAAGGGHVLHLRRREGSTQSLTARFVVDATGSGHAFARTMGARARRHDRLTCIAAFAELPVGSRLSGLTALEAVTWGWWYAARLPQDRAAVVAGTDPGIAQRLRLQTRDGWLAALQSTEHIAPLLGTADFEPAELVVRAAPSFVLDRVSDESWLAVGDAASSRDPISSRGIHDALEGGLAAADAIAAGLAGDKSALESYPDWIVQRFAEYVADRNYLYGLERRWPDELFWQIRQTRGAAA